MAASVYRRNILCQILFTSSHFASCFLIESTLPRFGHHSRCIPRSVATTSKSPAYSSFCVQELRQNVFFKDAFAIWQGRKRNSAAYPQGAVMLASGATASDVAWTRPSPRGSKDIVFGGRSEILNKDMCSRSHFAP
jgi:hypothetical protein